MPAPTAGMAYFLSLRQKSFAPAQLFLGPLALIDINDNYRIKCAYAFRGRNIHKTDIRPYRATVLTPVAPFHAISSPTAFHSLSENCFPGRTVFFQGQVHCIETLQLFFGVADRFLESRVRCKVAAVWSDQSNTG